MKRWCHSYCSINITHTRVHMEDVVWFTNTSHVVCCREFCCMHTTYSTWKHTCTRTKVFLGFLPSTMFPQPHHIFKLRLWRVRKKNLKPRNVFNHPLPPTHPPPLDPSSLHPPLPHSIYPPSLDLPSTTRSILTTSTPPSLDLPSLT